MTTTQATPAYGIAFAYNSTSIIEIREMDEIGAERDMVEVTNLLSPSMAKEFIGCLLDAGETKLELNYVPTNTGHKALITALQTATSPATLQATMPNTTSIVSVAAWVKSFKITGAAPDQLKATVVFKGTGPVTYPSA